MQFENYHLKDPAIDQSLHGHDGPINISYGSYFQHGPAEDVLAGAVGSGSKVSVDPQDLQSGGFAVRDSDNDRPCSCTPD